MPETSSSSTATSTLTAAQRKTLLQIARDSIAAVLEGGKADLERYDIDDVLRRPAGAFVTLNERSGELRGCIGSIHPVDALYRAVSHSAINAAFRDTRFFPIQKDELAALHIEISVMGSIVDVKTIEDIEPGRDGLIISRGRYAGLLLPQVAAEYGWDRETFLGHTCVKAGLPADAWRTLGTKIERFSAEVFGE
ncbi:MAG TPA: AmmeMemoRadiSam system protein A [Thermoanaerobaculia bacterium]|nr:AmmeMemoRadiSam system protein A [Thermoanaerobaculia bacterium]